MSDQLYYCKYCKRDLPWTSFFPTRAGVNPYPKSHCCKQCTSERAKAKYHTPEGIARQRELTKRYNSSERGRTKREEWNRSQSGIDSQRKYWSGERSHLVLRAYRSSDRGIATVLRASHRQRNKDAPSTLTAEEWGYLKELYGYRCAYCGISKKKLERDHVVAVSRGGAYAVENVVPCCRECNSAKNDRTPDEWGVQPRFRMLDVCQW